MKKIYPTGHVKIRNFPTLGGEGGGGLRQSWKIPTFFFLEHFPNHNDKIFFLDVEKCLLETEIFLR